jgi:hypothetical protein
LSLVLIMCRKSLKAYAKWVNNGIRHMRLQNLVSLLRFFILHIQKNQIAEYNKYATRKSVWHIAWERLWFSYCAKKTLLPNKNQVSNEIRQLVFSPLPREYEVFKRKIIHYIQKEQIADTKTGNAFQKYPQYVDWGLWPYIV